MHIIKIDVKINFIHIHYLFSSLDHFIIIKLSKSVVSQHFHVAIDFQIIMRRLKWSSAQKS